MDEQSIQQYMKLRAYGFGKVRQAVAGMPLLTMWIQATARKINRGPRSVSPSHRATRIFVR